MAVLLYALICVSALTFLTASVVRAVAYARRPLHLRWELYPVPHEARSRTAHGGSYYEATEWWTHPRRFNLAGEASAMLREIVLLRGLRAANRPLWYRSFPFHAGLYLMAAALALLLLLGLDHRVGDTLPGVLAGPLGRLAAGAGAAGLALSLVGACLLVHRRLTDQALRAYTTPGDIFNLLFFIVALGLTAGGYLARPEGSPGAMAVVAGLLSWDDNLALSIPFAAGIMCGCLLVAYIPFTHMSHFVAKYFTYHGVRWDDAPAAGDARMAARLASQLAHRPSWRAAHVASEGSPSWAEIASSNPPETKR